jgi:hypothetical protein
MEIHKRLEFLLRAAEASGLVVQKVPLTGDGGGLCVVKGQQRLFVDSLADSQTRYERTLSALAAIEGFPIASLPADVRSDMEREQSRADGQ